MTVYENDIGTKIEFDVGVDTANIAGAKVIMKKPNGERVEKDAELEDNSTIVYYLTEDGDLTPAGIFKLQVYIELDNWKGKGDIVSLPVAKAL